MLHALTTASSRTARWLTPSNAAAGVAAAFALALQVKLTLPLLDTPLRIAASDILLVLLLPFFLFLLLRSRPALLRTPFPLWGVFLIAATVALTWGLAIGVWKAGALEGWALKKYAGWFLLLGYGTYGLLLAFYAPEKAPETFIRCLLLALVLFVAAYVILAALGYSWSVTGSDYGARLSGFAVNPNAFAVILLCSVPFALTRERWTLFAGALCAGVLFTQSIAALISLIAVGVLFLLLVRQWKTTARVILVAGLVYAAPSALNTGLNAIMPESVQSSKESSVGTKVGAFFSAGEGEHGGMYRVSVPPRLETVEQAISLWRKEPLFGIGLGSFWQWRLERATPDYEPLSIHNTPVWVLTELGVAGLIIFIALFASLTFALYNAAPTSAALPLAGLLLLFGWAVMSLSAEYVYQRAPWFMLGLCLGVALSAPQRAGNLPILRQKIR